MFTIRGTASQALLPRQPRSSWHYCYFSQLVFFASAGYCSAMSQLITPIQHTRGDGLSEVKSENTMTSPVGRGLH